MSLIPLASQCKTSVKTTERLKPQLQLAPLERSEYRVLGQIKGRATVERILFWYIGPDRQGSYLDSNPELVDTLTRGDKAAMYDALKKLPDADALIFPRFERDSFCIPLFYCRETVNVRAKAIQLFVK